MPLHSANVGVATDAVTQDVDARWLMAYASSLNDPNPFYFDTHEHTILAHPVFPVCLEWTLSTAIANQPDVLHPTREESARAVHSAHDIHLYRPIHSGDRLSTKATLLGVRTQPSGGASIVRFDTRDVRSGELVVRTYQTGVYRGVRVEGKDQSVEVIPQPPASILKHPISQHDIEVPQGTAHIYTECARIWNPIHTDRAIALDAGLPDIILHGTATLALAISRIVDEFADGEPTRISRLGCRFSGYVLMPDRLTLQCSANDGVISFQVQNSDGEFVIRKGFACLRQDN